MIRSTPFWVIGQAVHPCSTSRAHHSGGHPMQRMPRIQQRDDHIDIEQCAHQTPS